jgi:hypothetical protein
VAETGRPGGKGQSPVVPREGFKKRQEVDPASWPLAGHDAADGRGRLHRFSGITGAQHTLAGAERDGLDYAREPRSRGSRCDDVAGGVDALSGPDQVPVLPPV